MFLTLQMGDLEDLNYSGFAFAFMEDDVQYASTSTAASCASPKFVDYLRSVIVASMCIFTCTPVTCNSIFNCPDFHNADNPPPVQCYEGSKPSSSPDNSHGIKPAVFTSDKEVSQDLSKGQFGSCSVPQSSSTGKKCVLASSSEICPPHLHKKVKLDTACTRKPKMRPTCQTRQVQTVSCQASA